MADSTTMGQSGREAPYLVCIIVFHCIATLVLAIRFFSKVKIVGSFGPDDCVMGLAWVVYLVFTITTCLYVNITQLGRPTSEVGLTHNDHVQAMKMLLASQILYNPILAFSKISILLFYRSLTPDQNFHRYCAATLIAVVCHAVAVFFGNLFQCTPIDAMLDHNLPGTCIDMGKFLLSTGAISSLLDLWIIIMPQRIILNLHLPLKKRIMLMGLFSFGIILVGAGVIRLIAIHHIDWHNHHSYNSYGNAVVWSPIEAAISLICASVPSFRPLFTKWFPAFFHTSFDFDFRNNWGMDEFGNRREGGGGVRAKILAMGRSHHGLHDNGSQEAVIKVQKTVVIEEVEQGIKTTNEIEVSHTLERKATTESGRRSSGTGSETLIGDEDHEFKNMHGSPPGLEGLHLYDGNEKPVARPRFV